MSAVTSLIVIEAPASTATPCLGAPEILGRALLERPDDWPQDPDILAWGEALCLRGGLPELALGFRVCLARPRPGAS